MKKGEWSGNRGFDEGLCGGRRLEFGGGGASDGRGGRSWERRRRGRFWWRVTAEKKWEEGVGVEVWSLAFLGTFENCHE